MVMQGLSNSVIQSNLCDANSKWRRKNSVRRRAVHRYRRSSRALNGARRRGPRGRDAGMILIVLLAVLALASGAFLLALAAQVRKRPTAPSIEGVVMSAVTSFF